MSFQHHCLAHGEVQAFKINQLEGVPDIRYWNGALVASWLGWAALSLGVLTGLMILAASLTDDADIRGGHHWTALVLAVATGVVYLSYLVERFRNSDIIRREQDAEDLVREATVREKEWVVSVYENHYEVRSAVRQWLKEGKVLRNRDVCAIRAYVLRVEPARQIQQLDRALARG